MLTQVSGNLTTQFKITFLKLKHMNEFINIKAIYNNLPFSSNAHFVLNQKKNKIYFSFGKDATINSSRSVFSDTNDLVKYVKSIFGTSDGIDKRFRSTIHCKGYYQKVDEYGMPVLTIGDPILDLITNNQGELIVEGIVHNYKPQENAKYVVGSIDTREIKKYIDEKTGQSITFRAWKNSGIIWKMGVEIRTSDTPFERAQINSQYGERVLPGTCAVTKSDYDEDVNDVSIEEYEWGINSPQPNEVRALCRAIWLNKEFSALVQSGSGCNNWLSDMPEAVPFSKWNANTKIANLRSKVTPAIVAFDNGLHMVFVGETSNELYHWKFDGSQWMPAISATGKIPGQKSKSSPALMVFGNSIHMIHLGNSSNDIWHSTFNGSQWTVNIQSGQKSKDTPALGVYNNVLHMVHIGNESNDLYHRILDNNRWIPIGSNNGIISGQRSKSSPALTMLGEELYMMHLGNVSNDIWHSVYDGKKWSKNAKTGQNSSVAPTLLGSKLIYIKSNSTAILESDYIGPNWSASRRIPGQTSRDTPALAILNGHLYMAHIGETSNDIWISTYGDD